MVERLTAQVHRFRDAPTTYRAAADRWAELAAQRRSSAGRFSVALSGGSTPVGLFQLLAAEYADRIDWTRIEVGFADERAVGPDDSRSNFGLARHTLLVPLGISDDRVLRIAGEVRPLERARDEYERALRDRFGGSSTTFDLVLLGMGPDGHTASLFPGAASLGERMRWVVDEPAPTREPNVARITLSLPGLATADRALFVVLGSDKRKALAKVVEDPNYGTSDAVLPAGRVRTRTGVEWFVDAQAWPASAELRSSP
jgi:6-phosphogluconolactonase